MYIAILSNATNVFFLHSIALMKLLSLSEVVRIKSREHGASTTSSACRTWVARDDEEMLGEKLPHLEQ